MSELISRIGRGFTSRPRDVPAEATHNRHSEQNPCLQDLPAKYLCHRVSAGADALRS